MLAVVAIWALAEAILFVIVADVAISWIAVRYGRRRAVTAAFVAAAASAAGGAMLYAWARSDPVAVVALIAELPGIDDAMIDAVARDYAAGGWWAMLTGAFSGNPYKLYALAAARQGAPLLPFLLLSVLVRLPRFLAVALLAAAASRALARWLSRRRRLLLLGLLWLAFYAAYFLVMPA